jgi:hypothetical protein
MQGVMLRLTRPGIRVTTALSVLVAGVGLTLGVANPAVASGADAGAFVSQINGLRAARGIAPLGVNGALAGVAQAWAAHLAATGVLAHNPGLAAQEPPGWRIVAENVGMGSNDPLIESSFAASPDHYNNMVDARLSQVGVGVASSASGLWVVEDFWGGTTSAPAPTPVRPPVTAPPVTLAPHVLSQGALPPGAFVGAAPPPAAGSTRAAAASAKPAAPAAAGASPTGAGTTADLNAVANQVQYFQAWD